MSYSQGERTKGGGGVLRGGQIWKTNKGEQGGVGGGQNSGILSEYSF